MNYFLVPSNQTLSAFDKQVTPLFNRIDANANESQTLSSLRDTLLPKLISGELPVSDAERFIKEAGI